MHTVVDDHSRVAYAEVHDDEQAVTAAAALARATAWFAARGVRVERVLSDNGGCYRGRVWLATCAPQAVDTAPVVGRSEFPAAGRALRRDLSRR